MDFPLEQRAQLIRTRLAQASSKFNPAGAHAPLSSSSASDASSAATSCGSLLADALRVEVRTGKRKASAADLEDAPEPAEPARRPGVDAAGARPGADDETAAAAAAADASGERKPSLWEVMLVPPAPKHHPASPRTALPQGLEYGYAPSSAGSASYHNYRNSPGAAYDPYDAYRPHLPASPSFYASPGPAASPFAAPFSGQARGTPVTSSVRGVGASAANLGAASPKRLGVAGSDAVTLRVPSPGAHYASGSFGRSPSATFPRPAPTAAAANHSYAQGLTTSPIINSSPKISSARTSIPAGHGAEAVRPAPASAGAIRTAPHPSPLGVPGPSHYPPGFGPSPHLPLRLQQHRQRLGGVGPPGSPRADSAAGPSVPAAVRGHRRTVSSTLSAVVNFQNAQRVSPKAKGPVEEYLTHHGSPARSPRKRRRSPPPSAPAQMGRPTNLADISAASALTAMLTSNGSASSQRGSTEPSESGASSSRPPLQRARSSTPPPARRQSKIGEDDAADILMLIHHSPSPAKPRATPRRRDVSGNGPPPPAAAARGRVLMFGDDDPGAVSFGAALNGGNATASPGGRTTAAAASGPSQEAGPSTHALARQGSQRSPKKARLGSGGSSAVGGSPAKPTAVAGADGGESGKENRGADGDPDSSSSSLFSQPGGGGGADVPTATVVSGASRPFSTVTSAATTTSLSPSHPGLSPPSPSTDLLTPAPSSLPLFLSPAPRSPSTPDIVYPPPSASTHASPDHPPPAAVTAAAASAIAKTGLNPTLAPTAVVQAGATPSWPDFGFLNSSAGSAGGAVAGSPRKAVAVREGSVKEGSPVVQLKLGGIA